MSAPLFPEMIPVPVCEYCATGDVAHDDTASVAVCVVTSEANSLTEYLCADHAALLFPHSWRTLSAIDPEALSTVARYSVGSGKFAPVFRFLPIGPPDWKRQACSGCGGCNDCEHRDTRGKLLGGWGDLRTLSEVPWPAWLGTDYD